MIEPQDSASGTPTPDRTPKMARPQPKAKDAAQGADPEQVETGGGSGSATGFVSMLAKRQFEADQLAAAAQEEAGHPLKLSKAREVRETPSLPSKGRAEPAPEKPVAADPVPGWYRAALPISVVLAVVLLGIGVWGIGALVYMRQVTPTSPKQVQYPLISWRLDIGEYGDYTRASRVMAAAMVACVPVAVLLVVMAGMLRARVREQK